MADTKKTDVKVKIIQDSYGLYRIADAAGTLRTLSKELADKMVESGHAIIVK